MPYIDSLRGLLSTRRGRRLIEMSAAAIALFVFIDAVVVHPYIWQNQPTGYYFAVKPLWVGLGLLVTAWVLMQRYDVSQTVALVAGGVVGIVYLQLYYTVVPVPIEDGPAIQIGLFGNLTEGLIVHFGAYAIGLVVVLLAYSRPWRAD